MQAAGLLNPHPDPRYRHLGLDLLSRGHFERGFQALERAAQYSDKAAQAVIAESCWQGSRGRPSDKALAYAWMDLAAERGTPN